MTQLRSPRAVLRRANASLGSATVTAPPSLLAIGPAVRRCVTFGTGAETLLPADSTAWETELPDLLGARLGPVALSASARAYLPARSRAALVLQAKALVAQVMTVEAYGTMALQALNERGVPYAVIKGPAVARFHQDPTTRPYEDIDLVVAPTMFRAAMETLNELGYEVNGDKRQPWDWFDRECLEGVNLRGRFGANLDVHHHIAPWSIGKRLDVRGIIERAERGFIGGVAVRLASAGDCLLVASLHVVNDLWKGDPSLISWRDITILSQLLGPEEMSEVFERADLKWFEPYIRVALGTVKTGSRLSESASVKVPLHRRLQLHLLGWDGDSLPARHPAGWALRLSPLRATLFLVGSAVPSPWYARRKHNGYLAYWRESLRTLKSAVRGTDFRKHDLHDSK